ncbi:YuiA family protein [Bacillus taeanensis]|nr:YuiA family protein [Bacillus taeanensis]
MTVKEKKQLKTEACPYCEGKGYFQLILGGSETCANCEGTGKNV